jgi:branched-chain amino acid aminotransferase
MIAEGPGENFFVVKNGEIFTPPLGTILAGITRSTIIEIARDQGITVTERGISLDDAYDADEAFFTGTAAEVTPIGTINDRVIGSGKIGPITHALKGRYLDAVLGNADSYRGFLTFA